MKSLLLLSFIFCLCAIVSFFLACPELARTLGALALVCGLVCAGLWFIEAAWEHIDDVNTPGMGRR